MVDLKARKVKMFRCHLDPNINGKAQNAFHKLDVRFQGWDFELTSVGVYLTGKQAAPGGKDMIPVEHLVPFANIQSIEFFPEAKADVPAKKDSKN